MTNTYFRISADADLPRPERIEAGKRNTFVGRKFRNEKEAKAALNTMEKPHLFVISMHYSSSLMPL